MRTRWCLGLLVAGLTILAACGDDSGSDVPGATLRVHAGQVEVDLGDGFSAGVDGQALTEGTTVRTGVDGRGSIEWFDGSVTRLDFGTTFRIVTMEALDSDATIIEGEQTTGNTYNRVTTLTDAASRFDIDTPTATASVQGTVFAVLLHPDGTMTIAVIEGTVVSGGVAIPAGFYVTVDEEGNVSDPLPIPDDLIDDDWLVYNCEIDDGPDCPDEGETTTTTVAGPEEPTTTTTSTTSTTSTSTTTTTTPPPPTPPPSTTTTTVGDGPEEPPPPPDSEPPVVTIDAAPDDPTEDTDAFFQFSADEPDVGFECSLDDEPLAGCPDGIDAWRGFTGSAGTAAYADLAPGVHSFRVVGTDAAGNEGEDTYEWQILSGGDVQVTLLWEAPVDLDLWVQDPAGNWIGWDPDDGVDGVLERDVLCGSFTAEPPVLPPERIFWPVGGAPDGSYTAAVDFWDTCGADVESVAFTMTITVDGTVVATVEGQLDAVDADLSYTTRHYLTVFVVPTPE